MMLRRNTSKVDFIQYAVFVQRAALPRGMQELRRIRLEYPWDRLQFKSKDDLAATWP